MGYLTSRNIPYPGQAAVHVKWLFGLWNAMDCGQEEGVGRRGIYCFARPLPRPPEEPDNLTN